MIFVAERGATPANALLDAAGVPCVRIDGDDDDDAEATRAIAADADWLVVDHYGLQAAWEDVAGADANRILVIDDLADRPHRCDVLVDPGRGDEGRDVYAGLVPPNCKLFLGPSFAPLRKQFRTPAVQRKRSAKVDMLVFFSMADQGGLSARALSSLGEADRANRIRFHAIVGKMRPGYAAAAAENITFHEHIGDMAAFMDRMDLAIGAGGVSLWERCSRGLPGITVVINDNQIPGTAIAEAAGATVSMAVEDIGSAEDISAILKPLLDDPAKRETMGTAGRRLVDGRGAERLAMIMGPVDIRAATAEDAECFWYWANEPGVRTAAFDSNPIPWSTHQEWYRRKLAEENALLFVAEIEGLPVGQVRFDFGEKSCEWEIDVSVAPESRGLGIGTEMLIKAVAAFRTARACATATAWVKKDNTASRKTFEKVGFAEIAARADAIKYRFA